MRDLNLLISLLHEMFAYSTLMFSFGSEILQGKYYFAVETCGGTCLNIFMWF